MSILLAPCKDNPAATALVDYLSIGKGLFDHSSTVADWKAIIAQLDWDGTSERRLGKALQQGGVRFYNVGIEKMDG